MTERNVLVTGASTGIGRATALHLDAKGWKVFAGVRKDADGDALRQAASERLVPVLLDITDDVQVKEVAGHVDAVVGSVGLQGLVNNAGAVQGGPVEYLDVDAWRRQFDVNVFGQVAITRALLEPIRRARGRIVFIGSMSSRVAAPLVGPYSASKAAIASLGETLRHELRAWGIEVTVVEPGAIKTEIWGKGRNQAAELKQTMPAEALTRYADLIAQTEKNIERSEQQGVSPDKVAAVIERALTSRRPPARIPVGPDAYVVEALARVLPDKTKDRLVRWFV